jgi:hypothetical protein
MGPIRLRNGEVSLVLRKYYAMKLYGRSGGTAPPFLTSAGDEW